MTSRVIIKATYCLVVFTLIFSFTTMSACADDGSYTEGYLEYIIEDNSITITGYFGYGGEVYVPDMIAGYPVSKIESGAFTDNRITCIYLPDTIVEVEDGAVGPGITVIFDYNTVTGTTPGPTVSDGPSTDYVGITDVPGGQQSHDSVNQDEHYDAAETVLLNDYEIKAHETDQYPVKTSMRYIIPGVFMIIIVTVAFIMYRKKKYAK